MHKEDTVHIYNGILLSHKKEWNWVICKDVNGPRDSQINQKGNKSERKNQISMHICRNWKNWYRWTYLQRRNRDTIIENKHGYQGGKGGWEKLGGWDWHIYTSDTRHKIDN